jgi:hypothetical protein
MSKMMIIGLPALIMLISKCHFKEVYTEELHEKEESKKSREDTSDIRENVKKS